MSLVDELDTLYKWLKNDIRSLVGPSYADRQNLLKFLVEQLRLRFTLCPHKIETVYKYLENHSDNLLEFVKIMKARFHEIAKEFEVSPSDVLAIYRLKGLPLSSLRRWEK